jgi:hypothetical protein
MNTQVSNFPAAVVVGALVCLPQEIDWSVLTRNTSYSQLVGVENPNTPSAEGLRFSSVDIAAINEANLSVESKATSSEQAELETIFSGLVKTWNEVTGGYSVTLRRYAHGSYQAILVLGAREPEVVTLILRELQQRPDWWFEALKVLTKENPVKPGASFDEAVNTWIDWGKRNNRIS